MQLHQLKPKHKKKQHRRVGRGGKRGTYSGRGRKGQKARAGRRFKPIIRELIKRYPKLPGYRAKAARIKPAIVNLETLEKKFRPGEKINPKVLLAKKIIRKIKGKVPEVKLLGRGKLSKRLIIEGCQLSRLAKDKIEKANGIINSNCKIQNSK